MGTQLNCECLGILLFDTYFHGLSHQTEEKNICFEFDICWAQDEAVDMVEVTGFSSLLWGLQTPYP
jgi:hypothetical protein